MKRKDVSHQKREVLTQGSEDKLEIKMPCKDFNTEGNNLLVRLTMHGKDNLVPKTHKGQGESFWEKCVYLDKKFEEQSCTQKVFLAQVQYDRAIYLKLTDLDGLMRFIFEKPGNQKLDSKPGIDYHANAQTGFTKKFEELLLIVQKKIREETKEKYMLNDIGIHIKKETKLDGGQAKFGNVLIRFIREKSDSRFSNQTIAIDFHVNLEKTVERPAPQYWIKIPQIINDFKLASKTYLKEFEEIDLDNFREITDQRGLVHNIFPDEEGWQQLLYEKYKSVKLAEKQSRLPGKGFRNDSWGNDDKEQSNQGKKEDFPPTSTRNKLNPINRDNLGDWEDDAESPTKTPKLNHSISELSRAVKSPIHNSTISISTSGTSNDSSSCSSSSSSSSSSSFSSSPTVK